MKANELADYVLNVIMGVEDFEGERFEKIAAMLRQQQAEIEALKDKLYLTKQSGGLHQPFGYDLCF